MLIASVQQTATYILYMFSGFSLLVDLQRCYLGHISALNMSLSCANHVPSDRRVAVCALYFVVDVVNIGDSKLLRIIMECAAIA